MSDTEKIVLWLAGLLGTAGVFVLLRSFFSPEARARRRRDRSHGRVISRQHGPSVRLAVETETPKRDQKR